MGNFYPNLYNPANAAVFDSNGNICGGAFNASTAQTPAATAASPGFGHQSELCAEKVISSI